MRKYINLILLAIVLSINIFFRMMPASLPFTKNMARDSIMGSLMQNALKQIDERFKELPPQVKFKAAQDLVDLWKKEKKKSINEEIRTKQKELKSYWQDESGHTFLLELDPYHWVRLVKNLTTTGKIGDKIINTVQYDSFMLAPLGMKVEPSLHKNLHVYLSYFFFKVAKIFDKGISLMHLVFYMPVLISSLILILIFFLCPSIKQNEINISGFFAAMTLGLSPIFIMRSMAGFFDTDPYIILFSLLSLWTFYLSLSYSISFKLRLFYAVISGISIGLFSLIWDGWWYIFDLIVFSAIFYTLNLYLVKKTANKKIDLSSSLAAVFLFLLSSVISISILSGWQVFKQFIFGPFKIAFAKSYLQNQFWPNAFLTVQELNKTDLITICNGVGGVLILILGLIYLFAILKDKKSKDFQQRQFIAFLFAFWILIILYASTRAVRFTLLLIVPASVSFGISLEYLVDFLTNVTNRLIKIRKIKVILFVISSIIFTFIFSDRAFLVRDISPLMNKSWWDLLNKIKADTPKEAVINSWWDFGHWFKAISERRVIFDGATQNTPMAYWMGRVLMTDNEEEAVGVLRMLNSGSNNAFEELEKLGIDKYKCLEILNEIILLNQKDAEAALIKYIPKKENREKILRYTHNPQAAYFIVEPSLMYKMGAISFLGRWDFKKADIYQRFNELKKEELIDYLIKKYKYNKQDSLSLYDTLVFLDPEGALSWISPRYEYLGESAGFRKEGNILFFSNGFVVNITNQTVFFNDTNQKKWLIPKSMFYLDEETLKEVRFKDSDMDSSLLLIHNQDDYRLIPLDRKIANSMLTRLYYLNGVGLKYFKPFITEELKGNNKDRIIVYKIDWKQK